MNLTQSPSDMEIVSAMRLRSRPVGFLSPATTWLHVRGPGLAAIAFGVLTVVAGGRVALGGEAARAAAGAVVPFVLWFNVLAGFVYVLAGFGLVRGRRWGAWLAAALAAATGAAFLALGMHILIGLPYESRTVFAMTVRFMFWLIVAGLACHTLDCRPSAREVTIRPRGPSGR